MDLFSSSKLFFFKEKWCGDSLFSSSKISNSNFQGKMVQEFGTPVHAPHCLMPLQKSLRQNAVPYPLPDAITAISRQNAASCPIDVNASLYDRTPPCPVLMSCKSLRQNAASACPDA
ncbi:hypothetical protein AVEN_267828-1 [Araneus ventricosus]|uniref:Uncharacterized protein n=1 Tax=Araneus ventricosus TaxID=182803 RepID=A0A4Y2D3J0_ARAVE|nr:hypothetical protein AVEN_267828-1 [Araneus ventricosus]